jgi:hypothetical protein
MSDGYSQVVYGDTFEQTHPPPGYSPLRLTVAVVSSDEWVFVRYAHSPSLRPVRERSLLNPKLWRLVSSPGRVEELFDDWEAPDER